MGRKGVSVISQLDWITVAIVIAIMICGWFSVCGASSVGFSPGLLSFSTRPGKQLVWIMCALLLSTVVISINQDFYHQYAYIIYVAFMLLLLVTIFAASEHKGSRSWLDFGPVSLQPAEFAKFATALALARYVDRYDFNPEKLRDILCATGFFLLPMMLIVGQNETGSALVYLAFLLVLFREGMTGMVLYLGGTAVAFFIVAVKYGQTPFGIQPFDLGTFLVLSMVQLLMPLMTWLLEHDRRTSLTLFCIELGTTVLGLAFATHVIPFRVTVLQIAVIVLTSLWLLFYSFKAIVPRYLLVTAFGILSIAYLFSVDYAFNNILKDHQRTRINVILGLEDDPYGAGYNVHQSMIAIGSGGVTGKGFMQGTQTKLKYVPEQDTDFIFCTVGEEQGFIGSTFVLLLYLGLILRLVFLAERQPSVFGRVYGYSVACILLFHLMVNVGMVLGIMPVIGIPLPFFSYGGSSLWGFAILLAVFLRIDSERMLSYS